MTDLGKNIVKIAEIPLENCIFRQNYPDPRFVIQLRIRNAEQTLLFPAWKTGVKNSISIFCFNLAVAKIVENMSRKKKRKMLATFRWHVHLDVESSWTYLPANKIFSFTERFLQINAFNKESNWGGGE